MGKIKVIELFAGVGGFRIGLEGLPKKENSPYEIVWSNQWEPSTKTQHANIVYQTRWPKAKHSSEDIQEVIQNDFAQIPNHDLLVGGFPCQDYSVATTLKNSKGLIGKKGVLWWSIHAILEKKGKNSPKYLFLENVDRLLKSPANQRGRDFAVMLASLNNLGYAVEWRVINAADYGMPQRRRRVFFIGYKNNTTSYKAIKSLTSKDKWLLKDGVMAKAFPVLNNNKDIVPHILNKDIVKISANFNKNSINSPFLNTGLMIDGKYWTTDTTPDYEGETITLGNILETNGAIGEDYYIDEATLEKWSYLKGAKKEKRHNKAQGFWYNYSEGAMVFPDALDRPSRTIITGEGGSSPSRFKHVVMQNGKYRRLTPRELEKLNMFPTDHTKVEGISDTKRAFFMGNALVVGVVEKIGNELAKIIAKK